MRKYILLIAALVFTCSFTGCKKNDASEGMEPDGIIQETDMINEATEEFLVETEVLEDDATDIIEEEMVAGEEEDGVVETEE